eukprot:scaffold203049_cov46-Attheya_sp.AAC.2
MVQEEKEMRAMVTDYCDERREICRLAESSLASILLLVPNINIVTRDVLDLSHASMNRKEPDRRTIRKEMTISKRCETRWGFLLIHLLPVAIKLKDK